MVSEEIDSVTGKKQQITIAPAPAESGLYNHGLYPFVLDPLFSVEGSPCGYSYIDICKPTQKDIDMVNHAVVKNSLLAARQRYFIKNNGNINEAEFANYENDFVHVEGSLNEEHIRPIESPELPSICVAVLNNKIEELKETSGNRDVNNGSSSSGVTAASAIAALQESAGKTSRDNLSNTYEAFKGVVFQVIELIRQFYDIERQFRITGETGKDEFISYSNKGIKPQKQEDFFGIKFAERRPQFDIEVSAQKATAYSKMSQNELALQFYAAGMFNPNNADQALACLEMMDFAHKQNIIDRIKQNATLLQMVQRLLGTAIALAQQFNPPLAQQIARDFANVGGAEMLSNGIVNAKIAKQNLDGTIQGSEHAFVEKSRERAQNSTQV